MVLSRGSLHDELRLHLLATADLPRTGPGRNSGRVGRLWVRFGDGRYAEGELSSAVQDIGGSLHPVLELADGETLVLFRDTEVSLVEEIGYPLSARDLAVLAESAIHGSSKLPLAEVLSWTATLGEHDVVEVTIRRSRLDCEPVALS